MAQGQGGQAATGQPSQGRPMGSSSLFFHLVVGYGSKFKYMGVFVDFLGFGRERKRSRCRGT